MTLSPQQMDRAIDQHFAYEAADDVAGVLATLSSDVEHDVVGWPPGPSHGREATRPFYEALFSDLSESRVQSLRRLYGEQFVVDESLWSGRAVGRPFGLEGRDRPLKFRLLHIVEFNDSGAIKRENVWIDLAAIQQQLPQDWAMGKAATGRDLQKSRTRKDLLRAAARLLQQGRNPSLDEVAEEALVSRATAYRYFQGVDALLLEASLDVAVPDPAELFDKRSSTDPLSRLHKVDSSLHEMMQAHEPQLRRMLSLSLQRSLGDNEGEAGGAKLPARQNRRTPLIDAALAPVQDTLRPAKLRLLRQALALIIGTEAMLVCKDVLQLNEAEARRTRRWAIAALLAAAQQDMSA